MIRTKIRRARIAAIAALALLPGCIDPATSVDSAPVLAADRDRVAAMIAADRYQLTVLLHPTLTYTHSNGVQDTKSSLIARLVQNRLNYLSIETRNPQVRRRGLTAVLTSQAKIEAVSDGETRELLVDVLAVYFLTGQQWQLAAYQSVPALPE